MLPRDTNAYGTIFGGVILSYIDQAGAIGGRREVVLAGGPLPLLVTVALNRVEFKQPVHVGDVVRFLTRPVRLGKTSITMHIQGKASRYCRWVAKGASSVGGMSKPRAFAVCKLMTNSNLLACMTGRAAGRSPVRMRPV